MELFREVHEELKESINHCEDAKTKFKQMKEDNEKNIREDERNIESYK